MSLEIGATLDEKYRIVRLLGEGGMGAVFEGENTRIRRRVAIKVLHAHAGRSAEVFARFEREAQAAGKIGNDHILDVFDLGSLPGGERYMVLEYLDGETLASRKERLGRMRPEQLLPIVLQTLSGLKAAHNAGITHRDLKPDNIFILREKAGRPDFVKIIDFGISKFHQGDSALQMTQAGAVLGTPYYMSPEQAKGAGTDSRTDLYALGVIMYECVTGALPFDAQTFNELLFKIALSEPTAPRAIVADLDPEFEAIMLKAMARDLEQRFKSASEFASALDGWARARGVLTGASSWATAAAAPAASAPETVGRPEQSAHALPAATSSTWSSSQSKAPAKGSRLGLLLAAVAALLVAGGAFAAFRFARSAPSSVTTADSASAAAPPVPPPAPGSVALAPSATAAPSSEPIVTPSASAPASAVPPAATAPRARNVARPKSTKPSSNKDQWGY